MRIFVSEEIRVLVAAFLATEKWLGQSSALDAPGQVALFDADVCSARGAALDAMVAAQSARSSSNG